MNFTALRPSQDAFATSFSPVVFRSSIDESILIDDEQFLLQHYREFAGFFNEALRIEVGDARPKIEKVMSHLTGKPWVMNDAEVPLAISFPTAVDALSLMRRVRGDQLHRLAGKVRKHKHLHSNQIRSMVRYMVAMALHVGRPNVFVAPTQSGKTGSCLAIFFFVPSLMAALTANKVVYAPTFLSTVMRSHNAQTISDARHIYELYGDADISVDPDTDLCQFFKTVYAR